MAMLCGALVGLEREWRDRAAGLRTHMLVTLGSTLFTLLSLYGAAEWIEFSVNAPGTRPLYTADPGRIAAQIVSGIGFIGAGAIWRSRTSVHGVTTAASLWIMAAIGMAIGMGWYIPAAVSTLGILLVLVALRLVSHAVREQAIDNVARDAVVHVRIADSSVAERVLSELDRAAALVHRTELSRSESPSEPRTLTCVIHALDAHKMPSLVGTLSHIEGVQGLEVEAR
jgi:putative Mg2+ transporter-C (MgtC) family protein